MTGFNSWLVLLWLASAAYVHADPRQLTLPLTVPYALLNSRGGADTALESFSDGPCRRLHARDSRLEPRAGQIHLVTAVDATLGIELFGRCIAPLHLQGQVDVILEPYLNAQWQLHFRLGEMQLRDARGGPAPLLSFLWKLSRGYVNRRVAAYSFDLSTPRAQIHNILQALVVPEALTEIETIVAGARPGTLVAGERGIELQVHLPLPDSLNTVIAPPEQTPELSAEQMLERLDAFLLVVIKRLAAELPALQVRAQLVDLLLDSRYRLVAILTDPSDTAGNPVRDLFLDDWESLREILLQAEASGLTQTQLTRYVAFLNAGDVLLAIDRVYPTVGLWLSESGLRALLYELAPSYPGDPLDYGFAVDPALRLLLGLPPEPPPGPPSDSQETELEAPLPEAPAPELQPDAEPELDADPPSPDDGEEDASSGSADLASTVLRQLAAWLVPAAQAAEATDDPVTDLHHHLGRRVPRTDELETYAAQVGELLTQVTESELATADLATAYAEVFRDLVPATALIESCWRQFKLADGKPTFVVSSGGAVGMMQINQRVWRGIYDVERLKWETAYNVRAGVQILLRYLKGPGLDVVKRTGETQYLPRAAYAAYNAGPGGAKRFLRKDGSLDPGTVDRRLWAHYEGFQRGGTPDLVSCQVNSSGTDAAAAPAG